MKHYDVAIVGGGISGASLLYVLAAYTDIKSLVLVEKYGTFAPLNSQAAANSQTIHCGDIETNYTLQKATKVKRTARMVVKYALLNGLQDKAVFTGQKMAIGVGDGEVEFIQNRFEEFKSLYPYLEFFKKEDLAKIEPSIIFDAKGNERAENVVGMGVKEGEYTTINYGDLTNDFILRAKGLKECDTLLFSKVEEIEQNSSGFVVKMADGTKVEASFVVVNAGAHSLFLAHRMGLGKRFGTLPVAGSFYLTKKRILNGKVYMVQNPKLPFAALHGDPDLLAGGRTRFGPTALVMPKLERFHGTFASFFEFCKTLNFGSAATKILLDLLKDSDIRNYIARNFAFEMPYLNKKLFVKDARKIVPALSEDELYYAEGFGGVRPQVLDLEEKKLLLGEASIKDNKGVIFNMTPSPGATSCLGNAELDAREICEYLGAKFDAEKFNAELTDEA